MARNRGWQLANSQQGIEALNPVALRELNLHYADPSPVESSDKSLELADALMVALCETVSQAQIPDPLSWEVINVSKAGKFW